MKLYRRLLLMGFIAGFLSPAEADTLRCGSQLVSTDDRAFEVERKCGPPLRKDFIGYGGGRYGPPDFLIEEWVYGPTNGAFSVIRFEGNRVTRIETRRDD